MLLGSVQDIIERQMIDFTGIILALFQFCLATFSRV